MSDSVRSLGRGLSALLGDIEGSDELPMPTTGASLMRIDQIIPGIMQPRRDFDKEKLDSLASSITQKGVLQPLLVRPSPEDPEKFEIIAGERRWRASRMAGLSEVPVIVVDYNDQESLEIALIENLQRDDLNALEEAESFQRLMVEHGRTQEEVASVVSKSRSYVANILRLLTLPKAVQEMIRQGEISSGHARALINSPNPEDLANHIIENKLSVRATEEIVRNDELKPAREPLISVLSDVESDVEFMSEELYKITAMETRIKLQRYNGEIRMKFTSFSQIEWLINTLKSAPGVKKYENYKGPNQPKAIVDEGDANPQDFGPKIWTVE
jgi:ParB family chromosome partitioning protein